MQCNYAYFSIWSPLEFMVSEKEVTEAGKGRGVTRTPLISLLAFLALQREFLRKSLFFNSFRNMIQREKLSKHLCFLHMCLLKKCFIVTLSHDGLKWRVLVYTRSSTCPYKQTVFSLKSINAFLKAKLLFPKCPNFSKGWGGQESFIMSKLLLSKPPLMGGEV